MSFFPDVLTAQQYAIWINSCDASLVANKMAGWDRLYYDFAIRQPALLVHRGWGCIILYAEADCLALLREAQALVGVGRDEAFDHHVNLVHNYVERLLIDNDEPWNQLDDPENQTWLRKWTPLRAMPEKICVTTEVDAMLETVIEAWKDIKARLSPEEAIRRYDRLLSIQTNQLEGLFGLHEKSISRLVRIGFFPPAVVILQEGSLYFDTLDEGRSRVAQACEDVLKAINVMVLQSEGKTPIDAANVRRLHFECTFHSRFIMADPGPPAIHAMTFPGTFRQAVCSTSYPVGDKTGIVQYCNFREVPSEMDKMSLLFNQYLSDSSASPIDALKIAAWSHTWFSSIHPFSDGNGRVNRLLSSIPLLQCELPPINIMSSATSKKEYIDTLVKAQYEDDFLPLITVILNGMLESLEYIRRNCLEEDPDDNRYKHRGDIGKTKVRIVLRVPRRPG